MTVSRRDLLKFAAAAPVAVGLGALTATSAPPASAD
ncbi:MAG: twin-arginine translocation signal domain-containing protein, partial [Mycobacteriaceae bacterium]